MLGLCGGFCTSVLQLMLVIDCQELNCHERGIIAIAVLGHCVIKDLAEPPKIWSCTYIHVILQVNPWIDVLLLMLTSSAGTCVP